MMSKLSLLDKLKILGEITSSSYLFVVAIIILIILAIILIVTTSKSKKATKRLCIAIYGSITLVSLIFYKEQLFNMFDYMMDHLFIAIYFPNLAIYFAAIMITNIILWISILNRKITSWIRSINTTIFCIIHYLLILIVNIITKSKLDIFDQTSIYQNKNALGLIELSSTVFILWILFLILYKIIRIYQQKQELPEEKSEEKELVKPIIRIEKVIEPVIQKEVVYKKKIPDSIRKTEVPSIIKGTIRKKEKLPPKQETPSLVDFMKQEIKQESSNVIDIPSNMMEDTPQYLDVLLSNEKQQPKVQIKPPKKERKIKILEEPTVVIKKSTTKQETKQTTSQVTDIFDNLLTLDDYKKVLTLLKSYKENQQQSVNEPIAENKNISITEFERLIGKR